MGDKINISFRGLLDMMMCAWFAGYAYGKNYPTYTTGDEAINFYLSIVEMDASFCVRSGMSTTASGKIPVPKAPKRKRKAKTV